MICMESHLQDTTGCLLAKRVCTRVGESGGGRYLYKRCLWEICVRSHESSPCNERGAGAGGGKSACARDVDPLCVGSGVFSVEVFFEGARLMAASEGAGEGNVMGSASIKDFLEGTARVEPPRVGTRGSEGPGRGTKLGVRVMPCRSIPSGQPPRIPPGDHRPPPRASLSAGQATATVSFIVVTPRL